jgi:hypothetical protein
MILNPAYPLVSFFFNFYFQNTGESIRIDTGKEAAIIGAGAAMGFTDCCTEQ